MIAGSGPQRVAPHGGTEGRFGTNPIAFGFPSVDTPVLWDIGTAAVMSGEVMLKQRLGKPLPDGSAFDAEGQPTRDPLAALNGAFAVWGGHKGSGLAMAIQLLGMMCGASAAPAVVRDCGFFLVVINPELLTPAEDYKKRVSDYADSLRATRPLHREQPVRVPFERSAAERLRRLEADAIEVPNHIYRALTDLPT
jgi:LDH2 family malate/lactate/ureidoglycolate dehydrogenase